MTGKQVRLFLVDGTVGGLMTAEILNWTGHMLRGRRSDLGDIKRREEAKRTGVYVLFGTNDEDEPAAYIGEGDYVANRLDQHNLNKDFWKDVVIITSKDMNLTKAHVRYLESELIKLAQGIGRYKLLNGNAPTGGAALPEADESDMKYFISHIQILMPVLGFDIFRGRPKSATAKVTAPAPDEDTAVASAEEESPDTVSSTDSPVFRMTTRNGCDARAQLIDGEFTMLEGSIINRMMKDNPAMAETTRQQFNARKPLHAKVVAVSRTGPRPHLVTLEKDFVFTSPSAAAAVVYGRASANGRTAWLTDARETFGDWERRQSL